MLKKILSARTNVIGTALVAAGSSLLTVLVLQGSEAGDRQVPTGAAIPTSNAVSVLECGQDVY